MSILWEEILLYFDVVSQALQNEHVNLKSCADLHFSLADYLHASMEKFNRFVEGAKRNNIGRGIYGNSYPQT